MVVAGLVTVLFLGGCGSGDDTPPEQSSRQGSLVPANLDTLIAETGADRPLDQVEESTQLMAEEEDLQGEEDVTTPTAEQPVAEAVTQSPPVVREVVTPAGQGTYSVQLGSFSVPANAEALAAKVRQQGRSAVVEAALVKGRTYHRVFVRGLASRADAENLGEELRESLGINYLVLSK
jgi:cell division septation protein DedD